MPTIYQIARQGSLTPRFAITDETGLPRFEAEGRISSSRRLILRDQAGLEAATIGKRSGFGRTFEVQVGPQLITVRSAGFWRSRVEVTLPGDQLQVVGNISRRQYLVGRGGAAAASVAHQRSWRERFTVEVADGEDAVVMLAIVLAIERIREERAHAAAAGG
jgi:uncharacterized protein YxjI